MTTISYTPLWLSLTSIFCLISCFSLVFKSFKSKFTSMMLIGVLVGIAGLVISIISAVKSVKEWKLINENPDLLKGKGILILALSLDGIYLILLIILFAFITWIFIGYRHGL